MNGTVLTILLCVGIAALAAIVWLVIEAALTVRSARNTINDLAERVEPTLAHVEQITESLKPAIDRLDPLMERASLTVDSVNLELMQIDKILTDTSNITGTASGAVQKISDVANAPANLANEAADKLKGVFGKKRNEKKVADAIAAGDVAALEAVADEGDVSEASRIVTEWAREARETVRNTKPQPAQEAAEAEGAPASDGAGEAKTGDPEAANAGAQQAGASVAPKAEFGHGIDDDLDIDEPTDAVRDAQTAQAVQTDRTPVSSQTREERIKAIDEMLDNSSFFKD